MVRQDADCTGDDDPALDGRDGVLGLSDADSWLNRGRMNFALLWDRQRQPKPASNAVVDVLRRAK